MSRSGLGGPTYDQNLNRACRLVLARGLGSGERRPSSTGRLWPKPVSDRDDPMTERDETTARASRPAAEVGSRGHPTVSTVPIGARRRLGSAAAAINAASGLRGTQPFFWWPRI